MICKKCGREFSLTKAGARTKTRQVNGSYLCGRCLTDKTNLFKYGTHPSKLEITKDKMVQTNLKTYGHRSSMQSPEVYERWKESHMRNSGVDHPMKRGDLVQSRIMSLKSRGSFTSLQHKNGFEHRTFDAILKTIPQGYDATTDGPWNTYKRSWDIVITKYERPIIFVDCDGLRYHDRFEYKYDDRGIHHRHPDKLRQNRIRDVNRTLTIPEGAKCVIIYENSPRDKGREERGLQEVISIINGDHTSTHDLKFEHLFNMQLCMRLFNPGRSILDFDGYIPLTNDNFVTIHDI